MKERKCSICNQVQPIELFRLDKAYKKRTGVDSRKSFCNWCERAKDNIRKRENRKINKRYGHGDARGKGE
jgi:hypothetical protein